MVTLPDLQVGRSRPNDPWRGKMHAFSKMPPQRRRLAGLAISALGLILLAAPLTAQPQDQTKKAPVQLPVGNLETKNWLTFSTKPLEPGEIDRLVSAELSKV